MAKDYSVDEDVWSAYPLWKFHEIDHLIIDVDPDKIRDDFDFEYTEEQQVKRRKIQRVLERWKREDVIGRGMKPIQAVNALEKHGFEFPHRLAVAVRSKSSLEEKVVPNRPDAPPSEKDTITGLKKSLSASRRLLLAIAIEKFRYDPRVNKSAATSNIAGATERVGLKVHKDTILKHLRLALEDLDEVERRKLLE
ncbi:MAG: hypothetical protein ACQEVT_15875 [Pseudomonadota bacterium]